MATYRRTGLHIGVLAEEENDVDVLKHLTAKLLPSSRCGYSHFVGHGCGKLRRKCGVWAAQLLARGCDLLVVLHDRDDKDEAALRFDLESAVASSGWGRFIVVIPIEELEAWLLCDRAALEKAFRMRVALKMPSSPERVRNPKEALKRLVSKASSARYVNTIHNAKIAQYVSVSQLSKCPSFERYRTYLRTSFPRMRVE